MPLKTYKLYIRDNYAPYKPCCLGYDHVYYDRLSEGKDSIALLSNQADGLGKFKIMFDENNVKIYMVIYTLHLQLTKKLQYLLLYNISSCLCEINSTSDWTADCTIYKPRNEMRGIS